ncbi:DUF1145 domain-containing protein [Shewanella marina]|uniref:DUF1145 domain-containing protein n=1 Tax=Shewanella marina TaxID=487319 RepID=UPI0004713E83|nr:DUF1145 domain-containing protein [Shewanella marina]
MKWLIIAGKVITIVAVIIMIYNLIIPFSGVINVILNVMLAFTLVIHLVQVISFHKIFAPLLPLSKKDYWQVFMFGVFSLMEYRQQVLNQQAK